MMLSAMQVVVADTAGALDYRCGPDSVLGRIELSRWCISPFGDGNLGDHTVVMTNGGRTVQAHILNFQTLQPPDTYHNLGVVAMSVTISGPPGAEIIRKTSGDFLVWCDFNVVPYDPARCLAPEGYSVSVTANFEYYDKDAKKYTASVSAVRTYLPQLPEFGPPEALFTYERSASDPNFVSFTNQSRHPDDLAMSYLWDFGDGETSTDENPQHQYAKPGAYTVTLTATDTNSKSSTYTSGLGVVVNSVADGAALNVQSKGCDTGGTVDGEPECTLRAAIETVNGTPENDITFNVAGGGVPMIVPGSALPALGPEGSIDGTSQPAGQVWVNLSGSGIGTGIMVDGSATSVKGLAVTGATDVGISASGESGVAVQGNQVDVNPDGSVPAAVAPKGIVSDSPAAIRDNVVASTDGILAVTDSAGLTIEGNCVGVDRDGRTPVGEVNSAIAASGSGAVISNNTIRTTTGLGIVVLGSSASGSSITGNRVGVGVDGSELSGNAGAIRVDGVAGVTVSDNVVVSSEEGAIVTSGSAQWTEGEDGRISFKGVQDPLPVEGPVTGGGTQIVGNTVGVLPSGAAAAAKSTFGIVTWAGASNVLIDANTVASVTGSGVELRDGSGHVVTSNLIGTTAAGADVPVPTGVRLLQTSGVTVGSVAAGNTIHATETGVRVGEGSTDAAESVVDGNSIEGAKSGVDVFPAGASVTNNAIVRTLTAIVGYDNAKNLTVTGNRLTGNGQGISSYGAEAVITDNQVGATQGDLIGNSGVGIRVAGGDAKVERNTVQDSGSHGVQVAIAATGTLTANSIHDSGGLAIEAAGAPGAPKLIAVRDNTGAEPRTTLVVFDMAVGAGKLEVFANDSCGDPEARHVLNVTRSRNEDEKFRIIQMGSTSRDHFTVTFTNGDGSTSELSNCADAEVSPDTDGDGSVDAFDGLLGMGGDPTKAIIATDSEDLLLLSLVPGSEGARFTSITTGADPAPGSHPAGWTLPYGAIGFRVEGVEAGSSAAVGVTSITESKNIKGDSYWKYGPPTAGADPSWYEFGEDADSGTGAVVSPAVDIPGVGIRRSFVLRLTDGGRGDSDGGANGTITDPGGPVVFVASEPEPTTTTTTTLPTDSTVPSAPTSVVGAAASDPPAGSAAGATPTSGAAAAAGANAANLALTGTPAVPMLVLGVLLLILGAAGTLTDRHRTPRMPSGQRRRR